MRRRESGPARRRSPSRSLPSTAARFFRTWEFRAPNPARRWRRSIHRRRSAAPASTAARRAAGKARVPPAYRRSSPARPNSRARPWSNRRVDRVSCCGLQYAAAYLVELHRLEQRLEVALAEALVALPLDDLEEDRADGGLGE